ncbi:PIN domain-containing protein [Sulfolobus tengchongensis]|uniref:Ribonuclease VapC n=1 Tax=Sulfolobus tengchongensis TaxID=207809 RepID=A0AAX4KYD6_9CREN
MIVVDTNVLVYATLSDSEFFDKSVEIIQREDVIIPQIVVYEYIKVMIELTKDLSFVKTKLRELENFNVNQETLGIIEKGIDMLEKDNGSLKDINDYVILSFAIHHKAKLATYDRKLRKIAKEKGIEILP